LTEVPQTDLGLQQAVNGHPVDGPNAKPRVKNDHLVPMNSRGAVDGSVVLETPPEIIQGPMMMRQGEQILSSVPDADIQGRKFFPEGVVGLVHRENVSCLASRIVGNA
jgi:hypothetical protein